MPYGDVKNQFRFKPVNGTEWTETDVNKLYYRFIGGLETNTEYEFQARHQCNGDFWSDYSESEYFTTEAKAPFKSALVPTGLIPTAFEDLGKPQRDPVDFHAYPNPAESIINLSFNQVLEEHSEIHLMNIAGQLIDVIKLPSGESNIKYNLDQLDSGIYFVHFKSKKENIVRRIFKK